MHRLKLSGFCELFSSQDNIRLHFSQYASCPQHEVITTYGNALTIVFETFIKLQKKKGKTA